MDACPGPGLGLECVYVCAACARLYGLSPRRPISETGPAGKKGAPGGGERAPGGLSSARAGVLYCIGSYVTWSRKRSAQSRVQGIAWSAERGAQSEVRRVGVHIVQHIG